MNSKSQNSTVKSLFSTGCFSVFQKVFDKILWNNSDEKINVTTKTLFNVYMSANSILLQLLLKNILFFNFYCNFRVSHHLLPRRSGDQFCFLRIFEFLMHCLSNPIAFISKKVLCLQNSILPLDIRPSTAPPTQGRSRKFDPVNRFGIIISPTFLNFSLVFISFPEVKILFCFDTICQISNLSIH